MALPTSCFGLVVGLCLLGHVNAGDPADDAYNNLVSDLGPLLALFGEKVTMQFMSQSIGWADTVIIAMAPLGIITVIISAIRVGGATWLKAIIGRARETLATAEAEVMSSASKEVCELWNGQSIVRVMGEAPTREFIILFPKDPEEAQRKGKQRKPASSPPFQPKIPSPGDGGSGNEGILIGTKEDLDKYFTSGQHWPTLKKWVSALRRPQWLNFQRLKHKLERSTDGTKSTVEQSSTTSQGEDNGSHLVQHVGEGGRQSLTSVAKEFKARRSLLWQFGTRGHQSGGHDVEEGRPKVTAVGSEKNVSDKLHQSTSHESSSHETASHESTSHDITSHIIVPHKRALQKSASQNSSRAHISSFPEHQQESPSVIVSRDAACSSPNLSLNSADRISRSELRAMAYLSIFLQLGIVTIWTLVTYHPKLRPWKDNAPVRAYALPTAVAGNVLLVLGMLICSNVVVGSADTSSYKPEDEWDAWIFWLQKDGTINDQEFDSFAIYPRRRRSKIVRSQRPIRAHEKKRKKQGLEPRAREVQEEGTSIEEEKGQEWELYAEHLLTLFGTIICLSGYIVQFVGLRALHWSASVTQLGGIIIMVLVRALVRRHLADPPKCLKLKSGYELDWFAMLLTSHPTQASWLKFVDGPGTQDVHLNLNSAAVISLKISKPKDRSNVCGQGRDDESSAETPAKAHQVSDLKFSMVKGQNAELGWTVHEAEPTVAGHGNISLHPNADIVDLMDSGFGTGIPVIDFGPARAGRQERMTPVSQAVAIRQHLGHLTNWHGPAGDKARALTRAIEIMMAAFFSNTSGDAFKWSMTTPAIGPDKCQRMEFNVTRYGDGSWKASAEEMEAALSLWTYSALLRTQAAKKYVAGKRNGIPPRQVEEKWPSNLPQTPHDYMEKAHLEEAPAKHGLCLLGPSIHSLERDLDWWIPGDLRAKILAVREHVCRACAGDCDEFSVIKVQNHRITGFAETWNSECGPSNQRLLELSKCRVQKHHPFLRDDGRFLFAVETQASEPELYAQHMFSMFLFAAAKSDELRCDDEAELRPTELKSTEETADYDKPQPSDPTLLTELKAFELRDTRLSTLTRNVSDTGLGTWDEMYLRITSALSMANKLPRVHAIVDRTREFAMRHWKPARWREASEAYIWLFRTSQALAGQYEIAWEATALLIENSRAITSAQRLRKEAFPHERDGVLEIFRDLQEKLLQVLADADECFQAAFKDLLTTQQHTWQVESASEVGHLHPPENASWIRLSCKPLRLTGLLPSEWTKPHRHKLELQGVHSTLKRDISGWTRLHHWASRSLLGICFQSAFEENGKLAFFLDEQENINVQNFAGQTPLHVACLFGNTGFFQQAWDGLAEVNKRDATGLTPLHLAVMSRCRRAVRILKTAGADPYIPDLMGNTPLLSAVFTGQEGIFKDLSKKREDMQLCNNLDQTCLHLAASSSDKGAKKIAQFILKENCVAEDAQDKFLRTPLHLAAQAGVGTAVAQLLLENGANANARDRNGRTPLHFAAWAENGADMTEFLLERGASEAQTDGSRRTALHYAAEASGGASVTRVLLAFMANNDALLDKTGEGAAVKKDSLDVVSDKAPSNALAKASRPDVKKIAGKDARDMKSRTPLHVAAEADEGAQIVEVLLEYGADKEARDKEFRTPLHAAAGAKNGAAAVELLLRSEANTDARDVEGRTPLHIAAQAENGEAVARKLLEFRADQEAKDDRGYTPLHCAAESSNGKAVAELLLQNGADIEARGKSGDTLLHVAALGNNDYAIDMARTLLQRGADANARDNDSWTPLHVAAQSSRGLAMVDHLFEYKANLDAVTDSGRTPLHMAVQSGKGDIARLLIQKEADLEAKDRNGSTALHLTFEESSVFVLDILDALLEKGAKSESRDNKGQTPLHKAARTVSHEASHRLLLQGVNIKAQDVAGRTPLHIAVDAYEHQWEPLDPRELADSYRTVCLLLSYGANDKARDKQGRVPIDLVSEKDTAFREWFQQQIDLRERYSGMA